MHTWLADVYKFLRFISLLVYMSMNTDNNVHMTQRGGGGCGTLITPLVYRLVTLSLTSSEAVQFIMSLKKNHALATIVVITNTELRLP